MTDETIKNDCERLFPIYDGMTGEQLKQVRNEREGARVMAKLKNNRFCDIKHDIISGLDSIKDTLSCAMEQYTMDWCAEDFRNAVNSVIEISDKTSKLVENETLGTETQELPF